MRHFFSILLLLVFGASVGCPLAPNTIEHGSVSFDVSPDGEAIVFSDAKGDLWLQRDWQRQAHSTDRNKRTRIMAFFLAGWKINCVCQGKHQRTWNVCTCHVDRRSENETTRECRSVFRQSTGILSGWNRRCILAIAPSAPLQHGRMEVGQLGRLHR